VAREISERDVDTPRGRLHVRETGAHGGTPVVFVHGNCSSSAFFDRLLTVLPDDLHGVAVDLRGYGDTEPLPIDATRGVRDFADDLAALLDAEGWQRPAFVAHSAGAGVVMQFAIDHPDRVGPLVLEAPMSPYGFGGTKDVDGTPCWPDFAGSGGGTANPAFAAGIAAGDRGTDDPASPRNVLRAFYVAPSYHFDDEEELLDSLLTTRISDDHYPGPATSSEHWPNTAPGGTGMNNAISPAHFDVSAFAELPAKPPVRWIRGSEDLIVSDTSMLDIGHLGAIGAVPGWPGEEAYPAQPMVGQMRAVLDRYGVNGGRYEEVVLDGVGHSPHLEAPDRFLELLLDTVRDRAGLDS
jgi:pimeloyl-ACP methyl ester carboxylesterase